MVSAGECRQSVTMGCAVFAFRELVIDTLADIVNKPSFNPWEVLYEFFVYAWLNVYSFQ